MILDRIQKLHAAQKKVAALEASIEAERAGNLRDLPAKFGFSDVKSFIKAVRAAVHGAGGRKAKGASTATTQRGRRRKRAVITDATRAQVKKLVEAGKAGGEIAEHVGISLPSVSNIKKALGLTRAGKAKAK